MQKGGEQMNGNSGIVPTVDLATNNNAGFAYPYPVMSGFGNGGFGGFGSDDQIGRASCRERV